MGMVWWESAVSATQKIKLSKCTDHCIANVILEDKDGKEHRVTIFDNVLKKILSLNGVADEGDIYLINCCRHLY